MTNQQQYNLFKKEVRKLLDEWGVKGYRVTFSRKDIGCNANTTVDIDARKAHFSFSNNLKKEEWENVNAEYIKHLARHEVLHLILWRLTDLGYRRFVMEKDMNEAEHEVIQQLIHIIENK